MRVSLPTDRDAELQLFRLSSVVASGAFRLSSRRCRRFFLPWLRRRRTAAQDFVVRLTIADAAVQRACHRSRDVPSIGIPPGPSLPPRARRRRRRYRHGGRWIRGSLESGNNSNVTRHLEVSIMPQCAAWGAQLEPPVRALHVVCVKSLYRIAGRDYCSNTSSGQRWPPALSPWSGPAPYRRRLCSGSNLNPSGAMSSNRTNGFTKNAPCHQASRQPRGRRCDAALARSAVLPAEGAAMVRGIAAELVCAASGATLSESGGIPEMALATGAPKCWVFGNISE